MKFLGREFQLIKITPWMWTIIILVIALAVYGIYAAGAAKPGANALSPEVSVTQAVALRDQGAFILDVRQPDEWAAGHIEGATLIPLGELAARLSDVPKNRAIVVVCQSGRRSARGRDILLSNGFSQVTSMAGGMSAWSAQGMATVTGP